MNLLVISHTAHYRDDDEGRVAGWDATVRELDELAREFTRVVHVAPLHPGEPPANSRHYRAANLAHVAVPPAGGTGARAKLGVIAALPAYARAIARQLAGADAVHVRCPSNIGMVALAELAVWPSRSRRVWVKYAGDWSPEQGAGDPASFRWQRRMLAARWHGWRVSVNGEWPAQPAHVHSFLNPCLDEAERVTAGKRAAGKAPAPPFRLLFVGQLEVTKGAHTAVDVLAELLTRGADVTLELVGDGPLAAELPERASRAGVAERVRVRGWMAREQLAERYAAAHAVILPSAGEGWPKVLSEGMAHGAVPLGTRVGAVGQVLERFGCGRALAPDDVGGFADAVAGWLTRPDEWRRESQAALAAAPAFTYEAYRVAVRRLLELG